MLSCLVHTIVNEYWLFQRQTCAAEQPLKPKTLKGEQASAVPRFKYAIWQLVLSPH